MSSAANEIIISVFARTDTGMIRPGNEDAFLVADLTTGKIGLGPDMSTHRVGELGSLLVVSDGLGGAAAGEVASEMAVKSIREALLKLPTNLDLSERMKRAAEITNENIWNQAQKNPHLAGMGATLTAVLVHGSAAFIAQVGDSRAYLIRGDRIKQITKDQSLAQILLESGAIKADQASSVPQNVIMQALGTSPVVQTAITAVEFFKNDYLLLCSDGLSNKVSAEEMKAAVLEMDLPSACRKLIELANERGGEDNITVVVARFDGDSLESAGDSSNTITGSFQILSEFKLSDSQLEASSQFSAAGPEKEEIEPTTLVIGSIESTQAPTPAFTPLEVAPAPSTATAQPSRGNPVRFIVVILVLLVLAAAAFFGYKYFTKRKDQAQPPVSPSAITPTSALPARV